MHGQMLRGGIVASSVVKKRTDFQRIPSSFEPACSELIKCNQCVPGQHWKADRKIKNSGYLLLLDWDVTALTRRYEPALMQSW